MIQVTGTLSSAVMVRLVNLAENGELVPIMAVSPDLCIRIKAWEISLTFHVTNDKSTPDTFSTGCFILRTVYSTLILTRSIG